MRTRRGRGISVLEIGEDRLVETSGQFGALETASDGNIGGVLGAQLGGVGFDPCLT